MQIITPAQIEEWLRIDSTADILTLEMLEASAIDIVAHYSGYRIRPYVDADGVTITPEVPEGLKHAIAVLIHAHFDDRIGAQDDTMKAVERMCAPFRTIPL